MIQPNQTINMVLHALNLSTNKNALPSSANLTAYVTGDIGMNAVGTEAVKQFEYYLKVMPYFLTPLAFKLLLTKQPLLQLAGKNTWSYLYEQVAVLPVSNPVELVGRARDPAVIPNRHKMENQERPIMARSNSVNKHSFQAKKDLNTPAARLAGLFNNRSRT